MNKSFPTKCFVLAVIQLAVLSPTTAIEPTDHWLRYYGIERWEAILDQDGDGAATQVEFTFGTDPLDPQSRPPHFDLAPDGVSFQIPITAGVTFGASQLQTSSNLVVWTAVAGFPPAAPGVFSVAALPGDTYRFFRFGTPGLLNSDGDCLLDFEELNLFHTDPFKADTDGDGVSDCDELNLYRSDPNSSSPTGRGAISGKVVLDEDGEPATQNHPGLGGWTVFLDLDYDGQAGAFEPSAVSNADGSYLISQLDPGRYRVRLVTRPGWAQVFPALVPPATPDGFPDRVVRYVDAGKGPIRGPYGKKADPLPGVRIVLGLKPEPVDPSIVLGAPPPPPLSAPIGSFAHTDWLSLPEDSELTVAFDGEEIFDGPGADLILFTEGQQQEHAEVYLGSTEANLILATIVQSESNVPIDFSVLTVPQPVQFVKIKALDLLGSYPGMDIFGFEAINYRPSPRGHYDVDVNIGETVDNINFGVIGEDRPPRVFLSLDSSDLRAGQSAQATVTASDDVGLSSVTMRANGAAIALDANRQAQITPTSGGLMELAATATDTAGQSADTILPLIVRNADGSIPDLSGYGITGGSGTGGPSIRVISPAAGEILNAPRDVVGTIRETTTDVASWRVDYALADLVNPEALAENDPDYRLLNQGTGPVTSVVLGTLAGDVLPPGGYLVRVAATDATGTTAYLGFVVGVRVEPLDLRPEIVLTAPTNETTITFVTNIIGSVNTRQQLRDWYVEYAPLRQVNLQNLSDNAPSWKRIASGNSPVTNAVLAQFDTTLVPNDSYVIRVSAWNKNGLGWAEPLVLHVTGNAKLGNFAVEFTDVKLPLAGIPITIKRTYSSLLASRSGDFGYGWSLSQQDGDIAETVPQTGSGFISTPFRVGTRVYLTAPDGRRIGFTFEPKIGGVSFLGAVYSAVFKPDPGVLYTLAVPEGDKPFLTVNPAGEARLFFLPLPWNPDTYILRDKQGTRYSYDQKDGLIEITDANGNRVTFTETAIEHSAGPRVQLTRDASGRITKIVAPDGQSWSYQYDNAGDLMQVTYPGNFVATLGYSTNRSHFLEMINDPLRGPTQRTEYDENGRVTAIIDAMGNQTKQTWDSGSFTGTFTDARGNVTQLTYDARGNLLRHEDPVGGVTIREYRNPQYPDFETAITDPRGNKATYAYDERGNLIQANHPLRTSTTFTYDENDRVTSKTYRTGGREIFEHDPQGNLTRYRSPLGEWILTYTSSGLLSTVEDGEGGLTRFEYDGASSRPYRIVAPDGSARQFLFNAIGQMMQSTDQLGNLTRFEYDSAGRPVRKIDPRGGEISLSYDVELPQLPSTVTTGAGRVTRYVYDALGHVLQIIAPGGAITRYEYDVDGNRTAVVDPVGNRTEFTYDKSNRLVEETDPIGKKRQHSYDLAGNRTNTVDRIGRKRTFVYDGLNRISEERWHDPADDSVARTLTFKYDALDRISEASDPDATVRASWSAGPEKLLTSERVTYAGLPDRRIGFGFDGVGRRSQLNVIGVLDVRYTRDLAGQLRILTSTPEGPAVPGNTWRLEFWRNTRGDVTELRRFADQTGNARVSQTLFTTSELCDCRINTIEHVVATNKPLSEAAMTFNRDPEGLITNIQQGATSLAYGYDAAGQLTGVSSNGTSSENYTYDSNGNRVASHRHASYTVAAGNRLTKAGPWTLEYDGEGNLVRKSNGTELWSYDFDYRNRLTAVYRTIGSGPAEVMAEYRYDPFNRRIAVIRGGQTTWTYYDGQQPLMDYLNNETIPSALYFGGESLDQPYVVWRRNEGIYWTLTDPLGSVYRVLDKTGTEVAALQYDSYGNLLGATGTRPTAAGRFTYTGREWDAETQLYWYRARFYDPDIGRFINEDPIGLTPRESNLYRYVHNRPLNRRDPLGLSEATESGVVNVPGQVAKEAICEAGAEVASVYLEVALGNAGPLASAAFEISAEAACSGARVVRKPLSSEQIKIKELLDSLRPDPPTPEDIRISDLIDIPPGNKGEIDPEDLALDALVDSIFGR